MYGPFCVEAAAHLLPTSLLGMNLWPDSAPGVICLSDCKRFSNLQTLKLAVGSGEGDEQERAPASTEFLLGTDFPCLESVIIHDRVHCTLAQDMTTAACFPNVHTLHLQVKSSQGSRILVKALLAIPNLKILKLDVLEEDGVPWNLIVPKSSSIQHLVVTTPPKGPGMTVQLQKADIQYKCSRIDTVCSASILDTLPTFIMSAIYCETMSEHVLWWLIPN